MIKLVKESPERWQIQGDFDRHSLPECWQALNEWPDVQDLAIDLAQVSRLDSSGLAGLVRLQINARLHGVHITYRNASEQILRLAQMSNLTNMLSLN